MLSVAGRTRTPCHTNFVGRDQNITVTMDESIARGVRVRATELNTSVSRVLGDILRGRMGHARGYASAMRAFLARKATPLRAIPEDTLPTRDEIYDRPHLR